MMKVVITGATGLVGGALLDRLLRQHPHARFTVLVRSPLRWRALAPSLGSAAARVSPVYTDLRSPASIGHLPELASADLFIHCAADTSFSRPLEQARAVNTAGTQAMLALAQEIGAHRFIYVSTAFVAGTQTGEIAPALRRPVDGWVNAYEQSKFEAEELVRGAAIEWTIVRPATIACDDATGQVSQYNSVHRALHLCYRGLASILSGDEATPIDLVTTEYVTGALARLLLLPAAAGQTYHLCAGVNALPLGELLDRCYAHWRANSDWRRRAIPRPALADLQTYKLFEQAVQETADDRLRVITRALGYFAPQLCYPKQFDTSNTDAVLGFRAPTPASCLDAMIGRLERDHWTGLRSAA
jgi:nucleoside-diphosphate-sugar epimerase